MAHPSRDTNWPEVGRKLTLFAHACIKRRSWEDAQDLAQQAIMQLYDDHHAPWDPTQEPDLFLHLADVVRGLASNKRRVQETKRVRLVSEENWDAIEDKVSAGGATPESALAAHQLVARTLSGLREKLKATDEDARVVVDQFALGNDEAKEQAAATGLSIEAVRSARRRVFHAVEIVREDLARDEESDEERSAS